ncbi:molybdate transport system substrate-binding protein [Paenibacillus sp. UNC496MF]|uniref:molybdate ABC transporter substrate-binding protein n=1 Tax=Paenibacillus sp. UNC496MF TaxID=1502753 RepID=UPI0008EC2CC2|nr:molybdate ABC transporter substrate-binding protein [Paenibacillus sp. UNC496MF]SFI49522.1 molybdate transport system substrate-binding protein [Paenibacillus sp. UNC496MF]
MMGKKKRLAPFLLPALAAALAGCGNAGSGSDGATNGAPTGPERARVELVVSAAASLTDALTELKPAFEAANDGIALTYNFGASGTLQKQIEQGAPADVFLSASDRNMDALLDQGLVDPAREGGLLGNELVVVVPAGTTGARTLGDLAGGGVKRLAIGIPESVPAGGYAKEALTNAGLWGKLQPKTVQGKDVRQVLQYVETGNADAGFVYKTDALTSKKAGIAFVVDPGLHAPIRYPGGVLKASKHPAEAAAFYDYLRTRAAADVFAKYGFSVAEEGK